MGNSERIAFSEHDIPTRSLFLSLSSSIPLSPVLSNARLSSHTLLFFFLHRFQFLTEASWKEQRCSYDVKDGYGVSHSEWNDTIFIHISSGSDQIGCIYYCIPRIVSQVSASKRFTHSSTLFIESTLLLVRLLLQESKRKLGNLLNFLTKLQEHNKKKKKDLQNTKTNLVHAKRKKKNALNLLFIFRRDIWALSFPATNDLSATKSAYMRPSGIYTRNVNACSAQMGSTLRAATRRQSSHKKPSSL